MKHMLAEKVKEGRNGFICRKKQKAREHHKKTHTWKAATMVLNCGAKNRKIEKCICKAIRSQGILFYPTQ